METILSKGSSASVALIPVSLDESLQSSLDIVTRSMPQKKLSLAVTNNGFPSRGLAFARYSNTYVFADDLILQVFVKIFSNAARYTDSNDVLIETGISEEPIDGNGMQSSNIGEDRVPGKEFFKVSIIYHGRGVPDDQKDGLFTRYLKTAKGNGLWLSIIHALITTRYQGRVRFKNRVAGDYTQGTEVEVWLLKAE